MKQCIISKLVQSDKPLSRSKLNKRCVKAMEATDASTADFKSEFNIAFDKLVRKGKLFETKEGTVSLLDEDEEYAEEEGENVSKKLKSSHVAPAGKVILLLYSCYSIIIISTVIFMLYF